MFCITAYTCDQNTPKTSGLHFVHVWYDVVRYQNKIDSEYKSKAVNKLISHEYLRHFERY